MHVVWLEIFTALKYGQPFLCGRKLMPCQGEYPSFNRISVRVLHNLCFLALLGCYIPSNEITERDSVTPCTGYFVGVRWFFLHV